MTRKTKTLIWIAPLVVLSDQLTKALILANFSLHESLSLIPGFFSLTYVQNTGAAFGMLAHLDDSIRVPFFFIVPMIALTVIFLVFRTLAAESRWVAAGLAGVVGGAVGNLIDRVRLGFVVDFLDFYWKSAGHFATFNIADAAICIGVGILVIDMLTDSGTAPQEG